MSKISLAFIISYFLIIPAITALPPPFLRLQFKRPNAPNAPDRSPRTTIFCISTSLQLKVEGYLHMEERGGMLMGLYIWGSDRERWGRSVA